MKMVYTEWGISIELPKGTPQVIQIEHPSAAIDMVSDLRQQALGESGGIIFSKDDKILSFQKSGELILNPFEIDFNSRRIQGKLFAEIRELTDEYCQEEYMQTRKSAILYMEEVSKHLPYALSFDENYDSTAFMKMLNTHLNYESESLIERIESYIKVLNQLCGVDLFVFVNAAQYLTKQQIAAFLKDLEYLEVHVLLIETVVQHQWDEQVVIDKDMCVIS